MPAHALTLRQFCSGILGSGDLENKLSPPLRSDDQPLDDSHPGESLYLAYPVRDPEIAMVANAPDLPPLDALKQPEARAAHLAHLAHQELAMVELRAWALLRWPELPAELRRDFTSALADEQRNCALYISRLTELGGHFSAHSFSNRCWNVATISRSPHGPSALLAAMGLTCEQANLDSLLVCREAFLASGDRQTADIIAQVHQEEIKHVALAARWIKLLGPPGADLIEAYSEAVPFPFSAARASAAPFDVTARRRAGLDEAFIEFIRNAMPSADHRGTPADSTDQEPDLQGSPLLYPNIGGEELPGRGGLVITSTTAPILRLWRLLFGPKARFLPHPAASGSSDLLADIDNSWWLKGLGAAPQAAAFPWLEDCNGIVPWISTARLQAHPWLGNREISSAPPGATTRVHDKAFAIALADRECLLPRCLRDLFLVLDPALLLDSDTAIHEMESKVASWPTELGRNFTIKPRLGTSGRGRVPGVDGQIDSPAVRGALKRLAKRGGAILEPWFRRNLDLAAQMHIAPTGDVTLLGTMEQIVAASGVYLGHRAEVDSRGRVFSGTPHDENLRETAAIAAREAFAQGYFGPCGIDAFSVEMRDDTGAMREVLRPIVEFNARFTLGTIVIGLVRRALQQIKEPLDLTPGARRAFYFGLDAPECGWEQAFDAITGKKVLIPLWTPLDDAKPAILFAESRDALDAVTSKPRRAKHRAPRKHRTTQNT